MRDLPTTSDLPAPARSPEPSPMPSKVAAVIPAHDEAPRIEAVVSAALRHLPVLVVDDGSSDGTAAVARAAGATVLEQRPNQGKGAALRAGFRQALEAGFEAVITLDGDGQHDPAEIPGFLGAATGAELVIGGRSFGAMPVVRRLSNASGTLLLSAALGHWIPDNQSGYRRIGRRLMAGMLDSREDGFAFEVEMIAVCLREGWPMAWVPIRTIYGEERSHIRPLRHFREFLAVTRRARAISRGAPLR
ncbi:MAG TPA: glycosyltransferase family 2 protein [Candidatus Limnocylindrales bacterium]|nr:glycosyltransferase family 2 protein [Candidatus Limnocylindrales bacterium]